ncbi:hypothetical protein AAHC03_05114 [Spirometra sp. Aus1]
MLLEFVTKLGLPDTFQSWFSLTTLHIWMCLVRLRREGQEGRILKQTFVKISRGGCVASESFENSMTTSNNLTCSSLVHFSLMTRHFSKTLTPLFPRHFGGICSTPPP